jgi:phospholipase/carboxylesterase
LGGEGPIPGRIDLASANDSVTMPICVYPKQARYEAAVTRSARQPTLAAMRKMAMSMQKDLPIQQPDRTATRQLLLLFHGVGSRAEDLRQLGEALAVHQPQACIVSVRSPNPSDFGQGWQWFSVQGVTEANRPPRVAEAMPRFVEAVRYWQRDCGIGPSATTLIGFSQGAIMALESTQQAAPIASRVVALAGRFAQTPRIAPPQMVLHLLHGLEDPVMPAALATDALTQWRALGGTATVDLFPGLGHGIDARIVRRVSEHLAVAE